MKITVLDTCTLTKGDVSLAEIDALGEVRYYDILSHEEIVSAASDADILLCNKAIIDEDIMSRCPQLKFIGVFATGYNNIDLEAANAHHICVSNVPGYSTDAVAQHVFAFILQFSTNLSFYNDSVHNGDWIASKSFSYFRFPISELKGKTLGIYGFGAIGHAVATIGEAFGMHILIHTRTPRDPQYEYVSSKELFSRSDYLTFHCPLTKETLKLINKETLSWMKSTAYIINTARGGIMDENALAQALKDGIIAGAGIDVLTNEPMKEGNALLTAPHCLITPHIGWAAIESRTRLMTIVANNVVSFCQKRPQNVVNHYAL